MIATLGETTGLCSQFFQIW